MADNFLTIAIDGLVDADLQRANAGDVKKINKRDDQPISHQAQSPSLHSYLFKSKNPPSLMAGNFFTIVINGLVDANSLRANAGDEKKINKHNDQPISQQERSPSLHSYLFY